MKNLMLVTTALIISIASVVYTQLEAFPPPFYGTNPDTGACEVGVLVGTCGGQSNIRCVVEIGDYMVPAFDDKIATVCAIPAYRRIF